MSKFWKITGIISFVIALAVSAFLYMQTNNTGTTTTSRPPAARFITN